MDTDKSTAIDGAKDAALGSVAFMLVGTKAQASSLKSSSVLAARAAVAVRKNVEIVVAKFKEYETEIRDVKKTLGKGNPATQNQRVRSILSAGGNAFKKEEYEQEEKPGVAATAGKAGAAVKSAAGSLLGLLGMAALLMNPTVRKYISEFFNGFLEGLGLSTKAIHKAKVAVGIAVGLLGLYFAYSTFMKVKKVFDVMKELAAAMGLFSTVAAEVEAANGMNTDELERRKPEKGKGAPEEKGKVKKEKIEKPTKPSAGKEISEEAKELAKQKAKMSELRAKRLKRVGAIKKIKGILSIGSKLLKASIAAAVAGVAIDVVGGTLLDIAMADDDVEIDPENVAKMALNNLVESVTFGLVSGPFDLKKKSDKKTEAPAPAASNKTAPAPSKAQPPTSSGPAAGPSSAPAPKTQTAPQVRDQSYLNSQLKTDLASAPRQTTVVNVNNTVVADSKGKDKDKKSAPAPVVFSQSVGATA